MIVKGNNEFIYKCPECDDFVQLSISLFDIPKNHKAKIPCKCGESTAEIANLTSGYQITVQCFLCGDNHMYNITPHDFWSSPFYGLSCPNAAYDIASFGDFKQIDIWKDKYDEMLESICVTSDNGYFENDAIMFAAMEKIKLLDDEDKIYCRCGNHKIDFSLYPDKFQFECVSCGAKRGLYTRSTDDYEEITALDEIVLESVIKRTPNLRLVKR